MRAIVMGLVEGITLAERIAHGPIPFEQTLKLTRQMADAFEYAHDQGVVHRDLKPANVKITPAGVLKVLDVSGDGQRFLINTVNAEVKQDPITVVVNLR